MTSSQIRAAATATSNRIARVLALTNQSGGAGKTTSAVNIGACAADLGFRTLVIDADAQCDASAAVGYDSPDDIPNQANLYDVLTGAAKLEEAVAPALAGPYGEDGTKPIPNLFVVLGSSSLEEAEQLLAPKTGREFWLRSQLDRIRDDYDLILIDCPGNLGLIVVNAIVGSDEVVACVKPGWKELRALTRMEAKIDEIRDTFSAMGAAAELSNILIVDCPTTRNQGAVYDDSQQQAKDAYEELVLPTVRRSPRIPEAYAAQKVLRFYDPVTENPSKLTVESALSATDDYYLVTQALGFTRR
ncbi:ParA family protein [Streptomyces chartreusis]|uniref:ParA family protein n=1 Tax=Streptomyces chartreusis TaxID=1969 RepID=UPI00167205AB|nr:AAA family ATPase [Streptomyces chartreusis]GGX56397.1 sporulation initiation inhibitor protein Soj [Streptomyces chartreusis]